MDVDSEGSIYVTGAFQDEWNMTNEKMVASGGSDIFLAKYDAKGDIIWLRSSGGDYSRRHVISEYGSKVKVDPEGNIYNVGVFMNIAKFQNQTLISEGGSDIFISKYDSNGSLIWANNFGGKGSDIPKDLQIDDRGNVFITGSFKEDIDFSTFRLTSNNGQSNFIVKLKRDGNLEWAKQFNSSIFKSIELIRFTKGGLLISGHLGNDSNGVNNKFDEHQMYSYIALLSETGDVKWTYIVSSNRKIMISDVVVTARNEATFIGSFAGEIYDGNRKLLSSGGLDILLGRIETGSGKILNLQTLGGSNDQIGKSISESSSGLIFSGEFQSEITLDGNKVLEGSSDVFYGFLDNDLSIHGLRKLGGKGRNSNNELLVKEDNIFLIGDFNNDVQFNELSISSLGY
ncbi:MAG: hypothetical protein RIF46_04580, partial [Cyclobacteriaceae bacterium]